SRFPASYAGTIAAGIRSGDLGGTLYAVSSHLRLKGEVRRAMIELACYPLIVIIYALLLISYLMRSVVPEMRDMFSDFGIKTLPMATQAIIDVSAMWPHIELAIGLLALGFVAIGMGLSAPVLARPRDWVLRHFPGISSVYWSSVLARFSHTSALAAMHGEPLPDLLRAAGAASGSATLAASTKRAAASLTSGVSIAQAVAGEPTIPALWRCTVESAGSRGELPGALRELARAYEVRAEQRSRMLRILLTPLLLAVIAVTIMFGIFCLILPMVQMLQSLTV
ncbi:MAG: type II secretion system F family protein, partial [Phycisphaerae bacterium]